LARSEKLGEWKGVRDGAKSLLQTVLCMSL